MARLRGTVTFVTQRGERFTRHVHVVKREGIAFDHLCFLVAFAGE